MAHPAEIRMKPIREENLSLSIFLYLFFYIFRRKILYRKAGSQASIYVHLATASTLAALRLVYHGSLPAFNTSDVFYQKRNSPVGVGDKFNPVFIIVFFHRDLQLDPGIR